MDDWLSRKGKANEGLFISGFAANCSGFFCCCYLAKRSLGQLLLQLSDSRFLLACYGDHSGCLPADVQTAQGAFEQIDANLSRLPEPLGRRKQRYSGVILTAGVARIVAGTVLAFARALGESVPP